LKKFLGVIALVVIIVCIGALAISAQGPEFVKEFKINSDAKFFKGGKKKGAPAFELVKLNHEKHAKAYGKDGKGFGCKKCHHELKSDDVEEQKKAKKCASEGCHGPEAKEKCLKTEDAMHQQCYKGCHKTDEKAMAAKAPTKCTECHVKADKK
jgi:hypothetical protein